MTNPSGYPCEVNVILYRKGTAGTITYRQNDATRIKDISFDWPENHPRKVVVVLENGDITSTVNLLNASCAQWSGGVTGALQEGDGLRFGFYQSDGSTVDVQFKGVITKITRGDAGSIVIEADDYLMRLDCSKRDLVWAEALYDMALLASSDTDVGRCTIGGINGFPIEPITYCAFAHTDVRTAVGSGAGGVNTTLDANGEYVLQTFIPKGNGDVMGLFALHINVTLAGGFDGNLTVGIYADNDGAPGFALYSADWLGGLIAGDNKTDFSATGDPILLVTGRPYWLKLTVTGRTAGTIQVEADDEVTGAIIDDYWYNTGAGNVRVSDDVLHLSFDLADYDTITPDQYQGMGTVGALTEFFFYDDQEIDKSACSGWAIYPDIPRCLLSYYIRTNVTPLTLEALVTKLSKLDTGLLADVNTNLDRTIRLYATRGKPLGDCLRELMDLYETSGTWSGDQHVMANYEDGAGIQRLKVGKRQDTSDWAYLTLAHGLDSVNDDELIIVGEPDLRQTNRSRYAAVLVTGKGLDGKPVVAFRSDRFKSGSFWTAMSGLSEILRVQDDNIISTDMADEEANRLLLAIQRNIWEGEIRLSGQHRLIDWDTTSDTYGSGKIVEFNWSPLGIADLKMKVTRMIMGMHDTCIYVNNIDPLLANRISRTMGNQEQSESFLAQTGVAETVFCYTCHLTAITTATDPLFMELENAAGTDYWHRIECTRYVDTVNNLRVYHSLFPAGFSGGLNGIDRIKLYDAVTGGNLIATIELTRTVSSIVIDEAPEKLFLSDLIIEVLAPNS